MSSVKKYKVSPQSKAIGFSLLELLVAMSVFMVVGGAAVVLVRRHMPLFTAQQNQATLNTSLRNAAAQMQLDVVNAGAGYFAGVDISAFPIGVSVVNRQPAAGGSCYDPASLQYNGSCFDTLNVITADTSTTPTYPYNAGGTGCADTTNNEVDLAIPGVPAPTAAQLNGIANKYKTGDSVLLINTNGQLTTFTLTQDADVNNGMVRLRPSTGTDLGGTNTPAVLADGSLQSANDPMLITATDSTPAHLQSTFCAPGVGGASSVPSWALRLSPITYWVNTANAANPQLMRTQSGQTDVVADQVIGFKVGVKLRSNPDDNSYTFTYGLPANVTAAFPNNSDWSQVLAVRVSLIGRTAPVAAPDGFKNGFDGGPYKIEAVSAVINPRNLDTLN